MKERLSSYFESLEDPRSFRNQRHPLITLIGTNLLAVLSGIDSFSGIQDFVDMHMDKLEKHFDFPHGLPSHDTYQRLWDALSPWQFKSCFMEFVGSLEKVAGEIIALMAKLFATVAKTKLCI
jgi:hypothetical protein